MRDIAFIYIFMQQGRQLASPQEGLTPESALGKGLRPVLEKPHVATSQGMKLVFDHYYTIYHLC